MVGGRPLTTLNGSPRLVMANIPTKRALSANSVHSVQPVGGVATCRHGRLQIIVRQACSNPADRFTAFFYPPMDHFPGGKAAETPACMIDNDHPATATDLASQVFDAS